MSSSGHSSLESPTFSSPSNSASQSYVASSAANVNNDLSNHGNGFLEFSHPPMTQFDYDEFSSTSLWEEDTFADNADEEHISALSDQLSELSFETSPSLRSVHLPTNQRVSSLHYSLQLIHSLSFSSEKRLISAVYSERAQKFVILDHAGIVSWCPDSNQLERVYLYPPYKHNLFLELSYSSKYNVYFILTKARAIITFNSNFKQVNSTRCFENSLLHLLFLETKSILIGAGVNGVSFWTYKRIDLRSLGTKIRSSKSLGNYTLSPSGLTKIPENKLIRKITISHGKMWIFALSFFDVYVISFEGQLIKSFLGLHKQTITDCLYNTHYSFLLTVSADSTLTLWSDSGFPIHVFNSAMKSNTAVLQHPLSPHLVLVATVKGFIKCYNLFTLEEEFTQYIIDNPILKIDSFEMSKQNVFYAIGIQNISLFDLNYFCEFWGPLGNTLTSVCFYRGSHKSERFHALCQDGTIRVYSIPESRPLCIVLPPPDITFPTSAGSVAYDRVANLLYILLAPQEIWVYTTKTHPACRLEVYTREVLGSILNLRDPERGNFVATGIPSHSFIPHCTCLHILTTTVNFTTPNGSRSSSNSNLLMIGLKDGRILFIETNQDFSKLFEMQASVGEVVGLQFIDCEQILSQSVSVVGFIIKIWSLPALQLVHSLELHNTLVAFWKVQDIMLAGFSDGTLSISSLKGMGSSFGGRSEAEEKDKSDEIISIHGIERFNLFCTAHKSGVVKIWDHHKNLIKSITLNSSLSGAYFLNTNGDLLVSLNRHFYLIKQEYVLSSVSLIQAGDTSHVNFDHLTDSAIFEDPNCKNGNLLATKHGFYYVDTMESYLKPYDIDLHGPHGLAILDQMLEENVLSSQNSSLSQISAVSIGGITSQVYLSDTLTPLVLSLDRFPLPIFSTPTETPRATPPPSEVDEREALREKLSSLKSDIQEVPITPLDSTVREPLEGVRNIPTLKEEVVVAPSVVEGRTPSSEAASPKIGLDLSVRRLQKVQITKKPPMQIISNAIESEAMQDTPLSVDGPVSTTIHTKVSRRRRTERAVHGISEILPNSAEATSAIIPNVEQYGENAPVVPRRHHILAKETGIRDVRVGSFPVARGITRNANASNVGKTADPEEIYHTVVAMPQNEIGQATKCTRPLIISCPSVKAKKANLQGMETNLNKVFSLSNYVDCSAGWQEREYLRRLSYRMKQYERLAKVWAFQANLQKINSVRRAQFESNSPLGLHHYPSITFTDFLNLMKDKAEFPQSQSRSATPYLSTPVHPPSTPTTTPRRSYSSSSFYAYKSNLDNQTNFRLNSKQDVLEVVDARVPPNSRCTSAPVTIGIQNRYDV